MPILEIGARDRARVRRSPQRAARVVALTLGLEDYTADLGVREDRGGRRVGLRAAAPRQRGARGRHCSRSTRSTATSATSKGCGAWGARSRALGFDGMGCVHPRQIPVIHEAFAPSPAEIERALRSSRAFREAQAEGLGRREPGLEDDRPAGRPAGARDSWSRRDVPAGCEPASRVAEADAMSDAPDSSSNAAGRRVPTPGQRPRGQRPSAGVGGARARPAAKHAPPIRSCRDYPANGDKRVAHARGGARALRPARRDGDLDPPSPAQRRPRRARRRSRPRRRMGARDLHVVSRARRSPATSR